MPSTSPSVAPAIPPPTEPAADERDSTRIWTIAFCRFTEAIAIGMLVPVLPIFLETLGDAPLLGFSAQSLSPEDKTSILFGLAGFAMAGIQLFSSRLSDAFDTRKPIIVLGMIGGVGCSIAYALITTYPQLLAIRIAQGLFLGMTFPPLMAIVAHYAPAGRGGTTLGIYTTIRLLGFASGPLIGGYLLETTDYRYEVVFFTSAALLLTSIALVTIHIPEHKDRARPEKGQPREPRLRIPVPFNLRILGGGIFFMMVGISGIISLFPTYRREFGATAQELGFVFSAFLGTRFLLQYAMGSLGDRWDKKKLLVCALIALGPTVALQGFVTSLGQLFGLRILLGACAAAISASTGGITADRSVPGNRARAMGVNTFSFSLGVAVGPLLHFFIPEPRVTFTAAGVASLVLAALTAWILPSDATVRQQSTPPPIPEAPTI